MGSMLSLDMRLLSAPDNVYVIKPPLWEQKYPFYNNYN